MTKEEDLLKTYLEGEFSHIDRRLSQIETKIAGLPTFLDKFGNAMEREVKSLEKAMAKHVDISKARTKEMVKNQLNKNVKRGYSSY